MVKIKHQPKIDGTLGWFETAQNKHVAIGQKLQGTHIFDFVIIGAGFTGLSLAHRLSEHMPDAKIAILDALKVGQGTSGRNAGFIINVPHNVDGAKHNIADDLKLLQLNNFAIARLRQMKDQFSIACEWQETGKYLAAHESHNLSRLDAFAKQLKADGVMFQEFNRAELTTRLGTQYYQRAIYTDGNILMNPAALVRGIAAGLPKSVCVFEDSPVTEINYGDTHVIKTAEATIQTKFVVEATNIFNQEFGHGKQRLMPIYTYASLTRPLSLDEVSAHFANIQPWGLTSAHGAGTTVRYTGARRILIRNVLKFSANLSTTKHDIEKASCQHRQSFEQRFPNLSHVKFDYHWGGMIAVTRNHHSVFKQPADNILILNGCNGVGVAKGTYIGYHAGDYIMGRRNDDIAFILNHSSPNFVPPDPIRSVVAKILLKKEQNIAGGDI